MEWQSKSIRTTVLAAGFNSPNARRTWLLRPFIPCWFNVTTNTRFEAGLPINLQPNNYKNILWRAAPRILLVLIAQTCIRILDVSFTFWYVELFKSDAWKRLDSWTKGAILVSLDILLVYTSLTSLFVTMYYSSGLSRVFLVMNNKARRLYSPKSPPTVSLN
jgi:hypothetical protein